MKRIKKKKVVSLIKNVLVLKLTIQAIFAQNALFVLIKT